jgi:hypothetical protein
MLFKLWKRRDKEAVKPARREEISFLFGGFALQCRYLLQFGHPRFFRFSASSPI